MRHYHLRRYNAAMAEQFDSVPKHDKDVAPSEMPREGEVFADVECPDCRLRGFVTAQVLQPQTKENQTNQSKYKFVCKSPINTTGSKDGRCNMSVTTSHINRRPSTLNISAELEQSYLS